MTWISAAFATASHVHASDGGITRRLETYFNLCAEEYLFYKASYIDEEVWQSWRRGMAVFAQNPRIRQIWEQELKAESYYSFKLD